MLNNQGCTTDTIAIFIVKGSTKLIAPRQQCKGNTLLRFHGNTKHICTVDSYIYGNNNATKHTVTFPWQKPLRGRATVPRSMYSHASLNDGDTF